MEKQVYLRFRPSRPFLLKPNACELLVRDVQIIPLAFRRQHDLLNKDWEFSLSRLAAIQLLDPQTKRLEPSALIQPLARD
jgi:hypothetical protein